MTATPHLLFLTVVSFLVAHELDAIRQQEWRFFFAPVAVSDETAYRIFTALHAPMFVIVLWYGESPAFQMGVDVFMIVHWLLHLGLRNHPTIQFESWFSRFWIVGGASLGAFHLLLTS